MFYRYNLNNLEALFKDYLVSGIKKGHSYHKNTIKNYLSDIRHFLGWFVQDIKEKEKSFSLSESHIERYKKYLTTNNLPLRSINRRLSSLRKFCFFCLEAKILNTNPAKNMKNISVLKNKNAEIKNISSLIDDFQHDLKAEGLSHNLIENYTQDIRKFFSEVTHYG